MIKKLLQPLLAFPLGRRVFHQLELASFLQKSKTLADELAQLTVIQSGVEQVEFPYLVLEGSVKLYGRFPSDLERAAYHHWRHKISANITEETIRVAMDVVLRYKYPHALPNLVPPYPRARRASFHPQHKETIWDLPNYTDAEKKSLAEKFAPQHGECFMDVGAYIGFGIVRMAREIGTDGRIIAVEADPVAFEILKKNVEANQLTNVALVPKAVGGKTGTSIFFKTERQANSLVADVVDAKDGINVEVDTIDNILRANGIDSLDRLSITINGAEVEAINGAPQTLTNSSRLKISLAGWYTRNGSKVCNLVAPRLQENGFQTAIGAEGGVFAWK